jgi:hypothetical protein
MRHTDDPRLMRYSKNLIIAWRVRGHFHPALSSAVGLDDDVSPRDTARRKEPLVAAQEEL